MNHTWNSNSVIITMLYWYQDARKWHLWNWASIYSTEQLQPVLLNPLLTSVCQPGRAIIAVGQTMLR